MSKINVAIIHEGIIIIKECCITTGLELLRQVSQIAIIFFIRPRWTKIKNSIITCISSSPYEHDGCCSSPVSNQI